MIIVKINKDCKKWKSFLEKNEHLIFHTPKYLDFIQKTFKSIKPIYIAVENKNEYETIFPMFYIKNPLFGKRLDSIVFLEYGGLAGSEKNVSKIIDYVSDKFKDRLDYLYIKEGLQKFDQELEKKCQVIKGKRFVLPLTNEESIWNNIDKQKRKAIKKAERSSLEIKELNKDNLNDFYKLYLKNMREFGSPPYPKRYFINFLEGNLGKCYLAYYRGILTAALLGFTYNKRIHITIAVSDKNYLEIRPNDLLHWHFIKYGIQNKYEIFDFGKVREESGQFRFKKKFGATLRDLNNYYIVYKGKIPETEPNDHKLIIKLWKNTPLFLVKLIGPKLREGLGI